MIQKLLISVLILTSFGGCAMQTTRRYAYETCIVRLLNNDAPTLKAVTACEKIYGLEKDLEELK